MTTAWRAFQTAIGAVPARPRPHSAAARSRWVTFRQAVGALPLKSGGGVAAWKALQRAIGAAPVLPSERSSRVGISAELAVEFYADLICSEWSFGQSFFGPEEKDQNKSPVIAWQQCRLSWQQPEKSNFKAYSINYVT